MYLIMRSETDFWTSSELKKTDIVAMEKGCRTIFKIESETKEFLVGVDEDKEQLVWQKIPEK